MLVDRGLSHSIVHAGKYVLWSRIEINGSEPIFVAECYFPHSTETKEQKQAWDELEDKADEYRILGHLLIMGDFNAHTGLDQSKVDTAGRLLLDRTESLGLHILNGTPTCTGSITRTEYDASGKVTSTAIDYIIASQSLLPHVERMIILEDRMGSDHHPILVKLRNLRPSPGPDSSRREVWKTEKIPHYKDKTKHTAFVAGFATAFDTWADCAKSQLEALQATDADNAAIADIIEHSFQTCLDDVTKRQLGTKLVGPPDTPQLTTALSLLNNQRKACEHALLRVVSNPTSSGQERALAVQVYREAKNRALRAGAARKELMELKAFTDIEGNLADSKILWEKANRVMGGLRCSVSPPPMVEVKEGGGITRCETDSLKTLKAWRSYWEALANPSPEEEAKYDNVHRDTVHRRLEHLRTLPVHQARFDDPITRKEVWKAIRKLKCGKAPGVDGILSTIIKEAADAVGTSKLKEHNPVVDSLVLLFNFVFKHEVWPKRWGQGIIFPLFKEGSRLDPGNYRPIALLSQLGKLFGSIVENRLSDWSEQTMALADEQGGFRRHRGTPELIFMLRETILTRKAQGQPTLTTFIDARKAYDSVWREGNSVRLHDLGVRGKLWRQLQVMNANSESKIRLPFGETEWFTVTRGVAQGAVESPFLYSCFINGLAEDLRERGLGVQAAGILTPLLMYADDIVLLASSVPELRAMNKVATDYAFANRYQFNGSKSNVMVFNASKAMSELVQREPWKLFGEAVEVTKSYKYLGVDLINNLNDWSGYLNRTIGKAERVSRDLAWIFRRDNGLLPRSAATLWKAIVRPVLEYAAELWAGDISKEHTKKAEAVQIDFARIILGLNGCQSIPDDFIRAELGMEKLTSRWEKLRLGYWRRLHVTAPTTTLHAVVALRKWQVDWAPPAFDNGWMGRTKTLLQEGGFSKDWADPNLCCRLPKSAWKDVVYDSVEERETSNTISRLSSMSSNHVARFVRSKFWGKVGKNFACFTGEIGRRGALVPEPYLDDRNEPIGRRLKLMCRAGCLPILKRVAREAELPAAFGRCKMCGSGSIEDIEHLVMACGAYSRHRSKMLESVDFGAECQSQSDRLDILLGKSTGVSKTDDRTDIAVKRFLKKAWRARKWLVLTTNKAFDRNDTLWSIHAHGDGPSPSYLRGCKNAGRTSEGKARD
jgi:predicted secreted protein